MRTKLCAASMTGVLLALILPGPLPFAAPFLPNQLYPLDALLTAVAIGDFNGDRRADIAAGTDQGVSVLHGRGDGTFGSELELPVPYQVLALGIGDFDGDGLEDVAAMDRGDPGKGIPGGVSVFLGTADGGFRIAGRSIVGLDPFSIAVADLNTDSVLDLVIANPSSNDVSILLGRGDGTFQVGQPPIPIAGPHTIIAADLNSDGAVDLAVVASSLGLIILPGFGDGTFGSESHVPLARIPLGLAAGDFNEDGALDLVVTGAVLLGDGAGAFPDQVTLEQFGGFAFISDDLDGDGHLDIAQITSSGVRVRYGNGDATFSPGVSYRAGGEGPARIDSGDLNGDGVTDLVLTTTHATSVAVLLNRDDPRFGPATIDPWRWHNAMISGDFNSDGIPDLAGAGASFDIYLGASSGTFVKKTTLSSTLGGGQIWSIALGDFNTDGIQDLAIGTPGQNRVAVFPGIGDGTFGPERLVSANTALEYWLAADDFNGDGADDLVVSGAPGQVLLGDGRGGFSQIVDTGLTFEWGAIGDFNGDGAKDLVLLKAQAVFYFYPDLCMTLGDGLGGFGPESCMNAGSVGDAAVDDVNGDGRLDLLTTDGYSSFAIFLGRGDGTLMAPRILPIVLPGAFGPFLMTLGDFNHDGRSDIVATDAWRNGDVAMAFSTGTGDLTGGIHFGTGSYTFPHQPVAVDVDLDGRVDLVAGSTAGVKVLLDRPPDTAGCPDSDGDGYISATSPDPACRARTSLDCDDEDPTIFPGAPQICDAKNNDCVGGNWPGTDGTNEIDDDGDSLSECQGDCDDGNASIRSLPGEVFTVTFDLDGRTMRWEPPPYSGDVPLTFDVLRASNPHNFLGFGSICLESADGADTSATDSSDPPVGRAFYYQIRAINGCPDAAGLLGTTGAGMPRLGRKCL